MRIQHNIMAMNAYRNLGKNNGSLSKNLEKLSSGFRINRAGDDAAGLAISEKMRAQIAGLDQAQKNAQSGINLVQTAEGALTEVHDMLNRMVTLSSQAANGTYSKTDREKIQSEINALTEEIDRIANNSNFNGTKLLDGNLNVVSGVTVGSTADQSSAADYSAAIGAESTAVDGVKIDGKDEVKSSITLYAGTITNTSNAAAKLEFKYNDNTGAQKTVNISADAGDSIGLTEIKTALAGDTTFSGLYDVTVGENNTITITAKLAHGDAVTGGGTFDATKADATQITLANAGTGGFTAADLSAAEDAIKEKYDGATQNSISYGGQAGTPVAYEAKQAGSYQVASEKLQLNATATAANLHNTGFTVGNTTYVIQEAGKELKGVPDTGVKVLSFSASTTGNDIATALAAQITADESTNGNYVATADAAGGLVVSESTNYAAKVLATTPTKEVGVGKDIIKLATFTTKAASSSYAGSLTLDSSKITNGTEITVGGNTYMLTTDPNVEAGAGVTKVTYTDDAAKALADAINAKESDTAASATNGTVTYKNASKAAATFEAMGTGLTLQIGADAVETIGVKIGSMKADALGIKNLDIGDEKKANAAIDTIKAAIEKVSVTRGNLGAVQNRLEHTINNLGVMEENIQDAEANIRDTDIADEMMAYTKNNILIQSAQAMLAQANQVPQGVLQLMG